MAKKKTVPKHLKPQRGLGQEITRARRSQRDILRKREENDRMTAATNARAEIERLRSANCVVDQFYKWANSLVGATVDSQTAVLRSMGMKQEVSYEVGVWSSSRVTAWTDFSRIFLSYPRNMVPSRDSHRSAIVDTIIDIRGLMQHEMGHLRFTVPFKTLVDHDAESSQPRIPGMYLFGTVKNVWNMLEDQRMETLVVRDVPHIRDYFTKMIYRHIINTQHSTNPYWPWLLVAGRQYLPRDMRQSCRDMFSDALPHIDSQEWFDIVARYKTATTYDTMIDAILEATAWYSQINNDSFEHPTEHRDPPTNYGGQKQESDESAGGDPSDACEPEQDDTKGRNPSSDDTGDDTDSGTGDDIGDDTGSGNGDEQSDDTDDSTGGDGSGQADGKSPDDSPDSGGKSAGEGDGTTTNRRDFTESLRDAVNDINDDLGSSHEITETISDANWRADREGLPSKNGSGSPMQLDYVDEALRASIGIQQALTECVTTTQPAWLSHQDSGAIDALSYRTKQVGALDYHRRLDGDFTSGLDIHVSMLCDVSGSMGSSSTDSGRTDIEELSIAMYAIHDACNALGIGSTYVLWSSNANAHRVWDCGSVEPMTWSASGGTNPVMALDDLTFHNEEGASKHLVIVFTDGVWNNNIPSLSRWSTDDRHIILVTLGSSLNQDRGADASVVVKSCNELPNQLAIALKSLI